MIKKILKRIAWGFAIFCGVALLAFGIFYIENHIVDNSLLLARNPDEVFSDTAFEDSVLQNTVKGEYFVMAKKYVEFMIVNGRDRYGKEHSPLFATTLDRETGNSYKSNPPKAPKGIKERDRTYRGANPSQQSGLYGLLYELSDITGDKRYAEEADKGIVWFWNNCQLPKTNLMPWGEHMGWDFFKERPIYWKFQFWLHELKGYAHGDKVWELAPDAAEKFAMALWEHQIYAKEGEKAGEFSRH